jgi:hypothetical protein
VGSGEVQRVEGPDAERHDVVRGARAGLGVELDDLDLVPVGHELCDTIPTCSFRQARRDRSMDLDEGVASRDEGRI